MKIDIVIPSLGRRKQLSAFLASLQEEMIPDTTVYVYFSRERDMIAAGLMFGNRAWLRYRLYDKAGDDFNMTEFWHKHMQTMNADVMGYFVDDMIVQKDCLKIATREFEEAFPDGDGVLGISSLLPAAVTAFGVKRAAMEPIPHVGCSLIGKKFAARFPDYQFYCPDYWHLYPARELLKTATEWGKVKLSTEACVMHDSHPWNGNGADWVYKSLRNRFKDDDHKVWQERRRRKLLWGLDYTLIRKEVLAHED